MVSSTSLLLFALSLLLVFFNSSCEVTNYTEIHLGEPVLDLTPSPLDGYSSTRGAKDMVSCGRVKVSGIPRWKIRSYANSVRVTLIPSVVIPESLYSNIEVCFHWNSSLGLCQCVKDEWRSIQKGLWSASMSPYDDRYVDVKFNGGLTDSVTVTIEEEFHQWRLVFLAFGFTLLLLAPVVSNWVPFYYSSSMAIGVFLVILILLFQGMKLLPTSRKNVLYLAVYGSVLSFGSFLVHYFSMMVSSILVSFGLSQDMHNPVSVLVLVGLVLAGAALGYWIVRKFVISEDGTVDVGIAEFVKWAMRVMAMTSVLLSTLDTPLAMVAMASSWALSLIISSFKWQRLTKQSHTGNGGLWSRRAKHTPPSHNRAEFLRRSAKMDSQRALWNSPKRSFAWSDSPTKGLVLSHPVKGSPACQQDRDYYSTYHSVPTRKRFSKKEYEDFTSESTRKGIAELASSPDFTNWVIENAGRMQLLPDDSSDDSMESGLGSSEENVAEGGSRLNPFNWY
ncbi:uncharacterized protein LOC122062576 [Macadamia integrifolia]|uniref:uncharacterized protein LOC122062576 n=1 Tax=Macadamia integrifolia TaxID=60698 RepID=UPI001C4E70DB|nr:uncharacterized protein LOC122062576 [Macadamia integrifolia]